MAKYHTAEQLQITKALLAKIPKDRLDLERSLRGVGDDTTKSDINELLEDLLEPEAYDLVCRIFASCGQSDITDKFVAALEHTFK